MVRPWAGRFLSALIRDPMEKLEAHPRVCGDWGLRWMGWATQLRAIPAGARNSSSLAGFRSFGLSHHQPQCRIQPSRNRGPHDPSCLIEEERAVKTKTRCVSPA
jgi:hypothetical protein